MINTYWLRWTIASATGGLLTGIGINLAPWDGVAGWALLLGFPVFVAVAGGPQLIAAARDVRQLVAWWPACLVATWLAFVMATGIMRAVDDFLLGDPPLPILNKALVFAFIQAGVASAVFTAALLVRPIGTKTLSARSWRIYGGIGLLIWALPWSLAALAQVDPSLAESSGVLPGAVYGTLGGAVFGALTGVFRTRLTQDL